MSKIDIGLYIQGRNKIQKQRDAINNVVETIINLLDSAALSPQWMREESYVQISFNNMIFGFFEGKGKHFSARILDHEGQDKGLFSHYADRLPSSLVPVIYDILPDVIEALEKKYPDEGFKKYFEFYERQA